VWEAITAGKVEEKGLDLPVSIDKMDKVTKGGKSSSLRFLALVKTRGEGDLKEPQRGVGEGRGGWSKRGYEDFFFLSKAFIRSQKPLAGGKETVVLGTWLGKEPEYIRHAKSGFCPVHFDWRNLLGRVGRGGEKKKGGFGKPYGFLRRSKQDQRKNARVYP